MGCSASSLFHFQDGYEGMISRSYFFILSGQKFWERLLYDRANGSHGHMPTAALLLLQSESLV